MKAKYALIALLAITFWGCDDNTAGLGLGMFPGSDQNINGQLKSFPVVTESVAAGRIYAKTNVGYVGKFTDPTFGAYQAGFLSTLNCPDGLTFPGVFDNANHTALDKNGKATNVMVTKQDEDITLIYDESGSNVIGNVRAIELILWYSSYFGDSLTACRMSVYELKEKLENADNKAYHYTDIDPAKFYDPQKLLGTKAYTAVDLSVSDSIRNLSTYAPSVYISLEEKVAKRVGENIMRAARKAGSKFNQEAFSDVFKGIYVKSDYGDGTILYVDQVQLRIMSKCYAIEDSIKGTPYKAQDGKDSTYYGIRTFAATREVIQANQLQNNSNVINDLIEKQENWNCTYLKTPAGIFTQATLPIKQISEDLEGDTLNAVKLTFSNYNQKSDLKFGMSIPSNILLIRKKDKDAFFAKNQLSDGVSSFLTTHNKSTNQYVFSNITKLINACINDRKAAEKAIKEKGSVEIKVYNTNTEKDEVKTVNTIEKWETETEWDKAVLIPVLITKDSGSYGQEGNVISIQHDLKPGYVRLKGGKLGLTDPSYKLSLDVIYTSFSKK